jgi:hypothetical protein
MTSLRTKLYIKFYKENDFFSDFLIGKVMGQLIFRLIRYEKYHAYSKFSTRIAKEKSPKLYVHIL